MDLSTRFARSLGFYDEARWSFDQPARNQHNLDHDFGEDGMLEALSSGGDARSPYSPYGSNDDSGSHRLSYLANESDDGGPGLSENVLRLQLESAFEEEGRDDDDEGEKYPPKAPSVEED